VAVGLAVTALGVASVTTALVADVPAGAAPTPQPPPGPPGYGATLDVAPGSTPSHDGLLYEGVGAVRNEVTFTDLGDESYLVVDTAGIDVLPAAAQFCDHLWADDPTSVVCDMPNASVHVLSGGGADDVTVVGFAYWDTDLGAGDDVIDTTGSTWSLGVYHGGEGDDRFVSGVVDEWFYGEAGVDTIDYSSTDRSPLGAVEVTVNSDGSSSGGDPDAANSPHYEDHLYTMENAVGTKLADELHGDDTANDLDGRGGKDQVYGAGGDDTLVGGAGNDILAGGPGAHDVVSYRERRNVSVHVDLEDLTGHGVPGENDLIGVDVEGAVGGNGPDVLLGDAGANQLYGDPCLLVPCGTDTGAADQIDGRAGADELRGGAGGDTVAGGDHDDDITGDSGHDTLTGGAGVDAIDGGSGTDACDVGPGGGSTAGCE
jgi:Ca2+-binding RTX toxin-like protein